MKKEFKINEDMINTRLDKALVLSDPSLSRTKVQSLIEDENVIVNGKYEKSSYKTKLNDIIVLEEDESEDFDCLQPENIPLDIVYEDEDIVVINKKAGMVVHPANGHHSGTLVNALLYHFKNLSTLSGETRPGIVHRIDKETSGLIMVAKSDYAHQKLQDQLKSKTANRIYYCLVQGELPHNEGMIKAPIGRSNVDRKKMMVRVDGKEAITHFKVIKRFNGYTLLMCALETGRTHQIRVHLSTIKFPIVGDEIYGPKKVLLNHMLLHASKLQFVHPRTNQLVVCEADLPEYFKETLDNLEKYGTLERKEEELWEQN